MLPDLTRTLTRLLCVLFTLHSLFFFPFFVSVFQLLPLQLNVDLKHRATLTCFEYETVTLRSIRTFFHQGWFNTRYNISENTRRVEDDLSLLPVECIF